METPNEEAKNVHTVSLGFVNAYLIVDADGLTLIDTGIPSSGKKIRRYIEGLGKSITDLKRIVLTHSDGDHMGSAAELKRASGATLYASPIEADAIAQGRASREIATSGLRGMIVRSLIKILMRPKPVEVDIRCSEGYRIPAGGGLEVLETPGHTPGHISLYVRDQGILFAGDSMRSVDGALVGSAGPVNWDDEKSRASVRKQAELKPDIVCVGHGPVLTDASGKFPGPR